MAMTTSISIPPPLLSSFPNPQLLQFLHSSLSTASPLVSPSLLSSKRTNLYHNPLNPSSIPLKSSQLWGISASPELFLLSLENPVENSDQIVSTSGDDTAATIISALLFIAFVGLSVLTIGVIYIGVTDFLQKRESEKFEKEEAAMQKQSDRKGKVRTRARAGPRGFGQKIDEDDDYADD